MIETCKDKEFENNDLFKIIAWFGPELENNSPELAEWLFSSFQKDKAFHKYRQNDWEKLFKYRKFGSNHHKIARIIKNDTIEELINFTTMSNFDPNGSIPFSPFETFDFLDSQPPYISYASFYGSIKCFNHLLSLSANPAKTDEEGMNSMHFAIANSQNEIIQILEGYSISYGGTGHLAALYHRNDILKWLVSTKKVSLSEDNPPEGTILHSAMRLSNISGALICLEAGISPNIKDSAQQTPLHFAAEEGSLEIVKFITSIPNVEIDPKDEEQKTPMHLAAERGETDIVKWLFEKGASLESKNEDGRTPLHEAIDSKRFDTSSFILQQNPTSINDLDSSGDAPIHLAVRTQNLAIVRLITDHKSINCSLKDGDGMSPFEIAVYLENNSIIQYMKSKKHLFGTS